MIIILAAAVILTISKNNPVESAKEATFKEDLRTFQDELALTISKEYTDLQGQRDSKITTSDYNVIKEKIPSFTEKYKDKFIIENDKLVGTDELTEKEKKWAESINVLTSGKAPFDTVEWDKTAAAEECFLWASDEKGQDGYNVIIGYKSGLQNYPKVRIPSRCHKIICDSSDSDEYLDDSKTGRSFLNNITKIEIPETVIEIGDYAFGGSCGNALKSIKSIDIPNSVTSIGDYAFYNCSGLTNITIPDSVTSIGGSAFSGCSSLTNITISDGVKSIGGSAFYGCSSLTNIIIPDSLKSIESGAFSNCSSLTNITIPDGVTSIGGSAFSGCSSLTNITIPDSVTSIAGNCFKNTAWYNNKEDGLVYINNILYKYKGNMPTNTSITIKEGTNCITSDAFENCSGLISITIPDSVTSIGEYAFYGCSNLTNITIPNSVTSIRYFAFYKCRGLTNIDFKGTKNECNNMRKDSDWKYDSSIKTITCTDGVITL